MAIALGGGGAVLPDCKDHAVTVDWGNFEGYNAIGVSGVQRLGDNLFAQRLPWAWAATMAVSAAAPASRTRGRKHSPLQLLRSPQGIGHECR